MRRKRPLVLKSIRFPDALAGAVKRSADLAGKDFSAEAIDLMEEALKMRRCPGIIFAEGPTGRRARIAGTGIEVWEIAAAHRSVGRSLKRLRKAYSWLSPHQLEAALRYHAAYPEEIDGLILRNEAWSRERLHEEHPRLSSGLA
jgi:uncharacterized protein (DUF433 family)